MQVTLENLVDLERKLQVTIPSEEVDAKVRARLSEIAAKVKMPGFRPGKIPFDIIKKNYTKTAYTDVLENLLRETYPKALEQEKLIPAGLPNINIVSSKAGEPFVYTAVIEVYPEIELVDLKQVDIEKNIAKVTGIDVDEMLENMRKKHATWQEITDVTRKAKVGDQLTIDFTIKPCEAEGEVEAKTESGVKFVLGDGYMWTDFEQPLYGVSVGEEKHYVLQMPDTHVDKTFAGKRVDFSVKVHKICEPVLPDLDDKFAIKLNIKEGGIAKLKEEVRNHMERELDNLLKDLFKQAIMNKLLERNPIKVPKALVEQELKRKEEHWNRYFAISSKNVVAEKAPIFPRDDFEKRAYHSVALGLLVSTIIKKSNIAVNPQEVREKSKELASAYYEDSEKVINKLLSDQKHLSEINSLLLEEKVIEHLASQANIIEKNISYKDALAKKSDFRG